MGGPQERRKFKRIDSSAVLVYKPVMEESEDQPTESHYLPAVPINVSYGGILFSAKERLEAGDVINIRLRIFDILATDPEARIEEISSVQDLVANVEVVRVEKETEEDYHVAGEIVLVLEGDLEKLSSFIQKE